MPLCTTCVCSHKTCPFVFSCSLWPIKKWKMLGVTPTSHGHRAPLCTMVHTAAWWCTTHVFGVQCSHVPIRWCTTQFSQTQIDKQTNKAYYYCLQNAGSKDEEGNQLTATNGGCGISCHATTWRLCVGIRELHRDVIVNPYTIVWVCDLGMWTKFNLNWSEM